MNPLLWFQKCIRAIYFIHSKIHSLGCAVLGEGKESYIHHHSTKQNSYVTPQIPLCCLFELKLCPPSSGYYWSAFYLCFPFIRMSCKWNHTMSSLFWSGFVKKINFRFIHVWVNGSFLFSCWVVLNLMNALQCFLCVCVFFFFNSFIWRRTSGLFPSFWWL